MSLENSNSNQPISPTNSSFFYSVVAANVAQTIISPASNPNGCILHAATFDLSLACNFTIITKSSTPTNIADGRVVETSTRLALQSAVTGAQLKLNRPIIVPAGQGIYVISDGAATGMGHLQITLL